MGRKNRRKPLACPVDGCLKRGLRSDLIRHASAVHPWLARERYAAAIDRGTPIALVETLAMPPRRRWLRPAIAWASLGLTAACAIGIVAYSWLAL